MKTPTAALVVLLGACAGVGRHAETHRITPDVGTPVPAVANPAANPAAAAVARLQEVGGESDWSFEFAPYFWLLGVDGDATVNGQKVDINESFGDLSDHVNGLGSLLFKAQRNRVIGTLLYDYSNLSYDDVAVPGTTSRGSFDTDMHLVRAAAGYQFDGWSPGQTIDVTLGVRYVKFDNQVRVNGGGTYRGKPDALDPMIMVRPSMPIFTSSVDGLRLNPIFGFGGGIDSSFIYDLSPQVEYDFTPNFCGRLGYRRVGWKMDLAGDNEFDLAMSGLTLGFGVKF